MERGRSWVMTVALAVGLLGAGARTEPIVRAEPLDPDDQPALCASDLNTTEQASQVMLALVSDPAGVAAPISLGQVGGFAPVGGFVERLGTPFDGPAADFGDQPNAALAELGVALDGATPPGLFASDEEGGVVQRFRVISERIPSARSQAQQFDTAEVVDIFERYGTQLREIGVTMAFAPVVDVGGGPAIGDRSYSDDAAVVADYAGAVVDGYRSAGVTPVLKHFPGHGRASADSHDGAAVTPPLDDLRQLDLLPFEALIERYGNDVGVMVGHLDVPGLTDGLPASLSRAAITGLLRIEMGFDGLIVSDALGMGAIRQVASPDGAIVMFLRAGGDLALVDWADIDISRSAIVAAVDAGRLEWLRLHHAVSRVLNVKGINTASCHTPWDLYAHASLRGVLAPE